jgi:hypothetical protein
LLANPDPANTWFRVLLAQLCDLGQYAVHTPDAFDRKTPPEKCIIGTGVHRLLRFLRTEIPSSYNISTSIGYSLLDIAFFTPRAAKNMLD